MSTIDSAVDIRDGEELDAKIIEEYIKSSLKGLTGSMRIKQFPSGFSNLTYLISFDNREMILRRPPFGKKAKTAHDMSREFTILSRLKPVFKYVPEPLLFCDDESVMDCPFYVMERIRGIILRKNLPENMHLNAEEAQKLSSQLISVFCELHDLDIDKAGLRDFGKPEGYVKRQIQGWSKRYRDSRTDDAPDFEKVMDWLHNTMPEDFKKPSIIHNDYKFDNAVLNPENPMDIIGILDWEMATIGDPLMDLGSSLAYWVQEDDSPELQAIRLMPTHVPGMLSRQQQVELYAELRGITIDTFDFYYCFGLFRLAVIAQQIYYRYFHGQTKDKRFAMLIHAVRILEQTALKTIAAHI